MRFIFPCIALLFCLQATAQIDPATIPGLELWVRGDDGVQYFGASVLNWFDQSGNGNDLTQAVTNRRPVVATAELNGFDVMRFDGADDYMDFPAITNIRTVFWVVKENEDATDVYRGLLGHSDTYHFIRGVGKLFWNETLSHPGIRNGVTRVLGEEIDGLSNTIPTGFKVISLVTSEPVEANRFSRERNSSGRVWDGDLAQLLIFSDSLSNEEVNGVEQYLYNYYTPALNIGPDINIADNFCDTLLIASPGYLNYSWSDGSENDSLLVNTPGTYWVDATDVFGRIVRDSVTVTYPGNPIPNDALICLGESFTWDTGLDPELYSIQWQDNSTEASFTVNQDSILQVTVIDNSGCVYSSNSVQITVDDFANQVSLGEDLALCVGQSIGLVSGNFPDITYLWSDGTEEEEFTFSGQPEVWVEVMNFNNCIAQDTILLSSLGNAPEVDFTFDSNCFNDNTSFIDQSTGDSELIAWLWDFGGDGGSVGESTSHMFSAPGTYLVRLDVADMNGCVNNNEIEIQIQALPQASFNAGAICSGQETIISDQSTSADGEIVAWDWSFPDASFDTQNPIYLFEESGFQSVSLTVSTEFGCQASTSQLVNVNPSPQLNIVAEGSCIGDFTEFSYEYIDNGAGSAFLQSWSFGDATSSAQLSPSHYYQLPGSYDVVLNVLAVNGCEALSSSTVDIYNLPLPLADGLDFCLGNPASPIDLSTSNGGEIVDWEWDINNLGVFDVQSPELVFAEAGDYNFQLKVTTEFQCYGIYLGTMHAYEVPLVEASFSPDIGQAPFEVTFEASANEECVFSWNFGGGEFLNGSEVTYVFDAEGLIPVSLNATNIYGCSSILDFEIPVDEPIMDLVLLDLDNNNAHLSVLCRNEGNYRLNEIEFKQRLLNGGWNSEIWTGELLPGANLAYTFNSNMEYFGRSEQIICVAAYPRNSVADELNLENNEACISVEDQVIFYTPYPNPAHSSVSFHFNLRENETVSLNIYNELGQEVWSAEGITGLAGYNSIQSDISNLESGIYVVKLSFLSREFKQYLMVK